MDIPPEIFRFPNAAPNATDIATEITRLSSLPVTVQIFDSACDHLYDLAISFDAVPDATVRLMGFSRDSKGRANFAGTQIARRVLKDDEAPDAETHATLGLQYNYRAERLYGYVWEALCQLGAQQSDNPSVPFTYDYQSPITEHEILKEWRSIRRRDRIHVMLAILFSPLLLVLIIGAVLLTVFTGITMILLMPLACLVIAYFEKHAKRAHAASGSTEPRHHWTYYLARQRKD